MGGLTYRISRVLRSATLRAAPLALLLVVAPFSPGAPPACAAESSHAGVVVRFDSSDERRYCVAFDGAETTGISALRSTGLNLVTKSSGGMGEFVCKIGDVGTDTQDCPASDGSYWSYFKMTDGGWRASGRGASSSKVGCGDVDGWAWLPAGKGSAPSGTDYAQLCPSFTCSAGAVPPPATSAAQTPATSPVSRPLGPVPTQSPLDETPPDSVATSAPGALAPTLSMEVAVTKTKRGRADSKIDYAVFGLAFAALITAGQIARRKSAP